MELWKYGVMVSALLGLLAGCGDNAQDAGKEVGSSAANFIAGVGEGIDQKMKVDLELDPSMVSNGLTVTLGKGRAMGSNKASVYVMAGRSFEGTMLAKALDAEGNEIGRARSPFSLAQNDAIYVDFQFNEQMDSSLVRKYRLSVH
jgi:hypothetical protein